MRLGEIGAGIVGKGSVAATTVDEGLRIDVGALPDYAFGRRSALFWGVLLFIAIESTALAIMFAAYLYVRAGAHDSWPIDDRFMRYPRVQGIAATGLMLLSCIPTTLALKPCRKLTLRPTRRWIAMGIAIGILACGFRAWEIAELPFSWSDNVYGSVIYTTYGMHTIELLSSVLEAIVMVAVLFIGPVERKHFEDTEVTAIFWWFANLIWLPFGALFYLDGLFSP